MGEGKGNEGKKKRIHHHSNQDSVLVREQINPSEQKPGQWWVTSGRVEGTRVGWDSVKRHLK